MLRTNRLKARLREGQASYGLISSLATPAAIELIAEAGFDFVIIDMEHVLVDLQTVEHMIRTAESYELTPLVRVADLNPKTLLRLLDGGAQGIVLPMIEDPQALAEAIAACRYHPLGRRSLNAGRPGSFGKYPLAEYVARANAQILLVAMLESAEGVRRAAEIAAVPGLDLVLEGAADLSQSLGHPWQLQHPAVQKALHSAWQACQQAGVPYCAIPRQPGEHARWLARGVNTFVLGDERGIAFRALQASLANTLAEGQPHERH